MEEEIDISKIRECIAEDEDGGGENEEAASWSHMMRHDLREVGWYFSMNRI